MSYEEKENYIKKKYFCISNWCSVNADDATASVAVFENLLNDRSFVVDTFTQDTMPESNPYGRLDGVANTDYLSTDFLKQYENDPIFKSGVSLYYRMNHTG